MAKRTKAAAMAGSVSKDEFLDKYFLQGGKFTSDHISDQNALRRANTAYNQFKEGLVGSCSLEDIGVNATAVINALNQWRNVGLNVVVLKFNDTNPEKRRALCILNVKSSEASPSAAHPFPILKYGYLTNLIQNPAQLIASAEKEQGKLTEDRLRELIDGAVTESFPE